jgi:hypothetical protein
MVSDVSYRVFLSYLVHPAVGTTFAAIVSLLVGSGANRVSTKDVFTLFENNTGWANSENHLVLPPSSNLDAQDGWAFLLSFTAPMWTLTGCE